MKIGIIGAGKVGTTLGKYLSRHGTQVTGYFSRTWESADEAATFTGTTAYQSMAELVEASNVIFITTPDGAIADTWQQLKSYDIRRYMICHFSGSLSSDVFSERKETGAYGLSIHPMYAFSDKFQSYQNFQTAYLTMEGDAQAVSVMKLFWERLGHTVMTLRSEDKIKYHAAAALASNEMLGLMQTSLELLAECGFEEADSMALLTPLVKGNISAMLEKGCVEALTGPIERNDVETVGKHLEALADSDAGEIYRSLGGRMIALAEARNPKQDYRAMRQLFEGRTFENVIDK